MTQVTKSTMIGELLQIDENIAPILLNIGMHCLGCPSSQMETIEEAAMVHGIAVSYTHLPNPVPSPGFVSVTSASVPEGTITLPF